MRRSPHPTSLGAALLAVAVAWASPSAANAAPRTKRGLCATAATHSAPPYVLVLSAFPAELAPLVAAAQVETTVEIDGRHYYLGRLEGVSVILGLMGIGLVNAASSTQSVLAKLPVAAVVVSGVAGSPHCIGDVVLAADWVEKDRKGVFHPNPALVALADRGQTALPAPLESCAAVPPQAPEHTVCLRCTPAVDFGGLGMSSDPYGGKPFPCTPRGGEIIGCELPAAMPAVATVEAVQPRDVTPVIEDMETAAVARVAARRGIPFLGVRSVSDGAGDPLGDRGFPAQFFDYYRLAAANEARVTRAVLGELRRLAGDRSARRICRLLAARHWRRAATRIEAR